MCSVFSHAWLFVTPGTVAHQAPLSMGSSKQEYWSGLPFSSPGDLPDAGNKPVSPALAGGFFTSEPPEKSLSLSLFLYMCVCVCVCVSVQFNYSVMSYSLQPHGLWHARLPCPTPTPRACSNSCSSSRWCHPTISSSVVPFSSSLHFRWPKYWSFSFSISPSNACSALISFRIDQFDLLAVQGTLLQHHTSKASIIQCSAFLMVQLSHPYLTTGKTIAFTIWIFVGYIIFKISVELPKNISVYS